VQERLAAIRSELGDHLLPSGCTSVAEALVQACRRLGLGLTAAESCTCGNVLAQLGAVPGVSAVLRQGLVAYHNDIKQQMLGVDPALLAQHGVVSEAVVEAMARGACAASAADLAIVSSGIAGPEGGSAAKPVGTVWVAAILRGRLRSAHRVFAGTRTDIQERAASWAILQAWLLLREVDGSSTSWPD
jgi:PncC family amidohydrolase